ncbi:MAG: aspartate--tRNA(Asn) ligase [Candidatus Levybacteria bacterium RIFCSPHIGHO2_01_FULL_40_10]|nr:MAG: aspartate--tRNA(Asn) ligase [Candidatus Levybacteria bacterium RIFCSPHIGHO2_01_FULL_40_10]
MVRQISPQVARSTIISAIEQVGKEIKLAGWVERVRSHGKISFFDLRDRSGTIQIAAFDEEAAQVSSLSVQDVVEIEGEVKARDEKYINPEIETGSVEIRLKKLKVISKAAEMPFDMGGKDLDLELPTLLDFRALTLRHPKIAPIFKVQEVVIDSFRKAMQEKEFTEFQSPVIIPQTAEGGAEVFEVDYFGHKAFLAQSPQFYKQILVGVYERVFTVNKTLRAEPSITTRHLAEVTTLDAEFGFIDSWLDVLLMAEYTIKYILAAVAEKAEKELEVYSASLPKVAESIPRLKLREAQEIIMKRTGRDNRKEPDLTPEDEREISKYALQEKGSDLIFITHYPVEKRPFYTYEDPDDPGYTLSADLIGKGIEWMTGGQRINDPALLTENAKKRGIDIKKSDLYLQAFAYGMPPEGGFSFGSERIVMQILGLSNIREASLFPRDMERVDTRFSKTEK